MNLLSKTAPLEESIAKMQKVLEDVGCKTIFSQTKHPLQNCYSLNLASEQAPQHIYSNGKGISSEASIASALGEFIERLQTNNFFSDFYLPSRKHYPDEVAFKFGGNFLDDELLSIYDPEGELSDEDLVDFNSDYEDKIAALPFERLEDGEKIYFPVNILNNLYVSNGLAAGNTPKEAQIQALSEIYERYAKIKIIKNGYALPHFPHEVLASFEKVYADVEALRERGYIVDVLDASLGGVFPVTAISLINPKNATLFVSFGAHPILEVSLERTMTELMQGRDLDSLDGFETPTFDMSIVADSFNLESHFVDSNGKLGFGFLSAKKSFEFAPWQYEGDSREKEFVFLVSIAKKLEKQIYIREYDYLGFYACQILIPSLSEVYPMEDLIYNNKNSAKAIRDMVLNFSDYNADEILDAIESLDASLDVGKYIGVIFKEPFTMAEFKAQIYLLLDERELATELLELGTNKLGRVIAELVRMEDEELDFLEYKEGLYAIFTQSTVTKAVAVLAGEEFLVDITLHNNYTNMLAMYDRLGTKKEKIVR
ncbi:MAG: YcaO-like family protein [Sulfurimonas sp.]|uniref:YcaO-like family protein n=1 Tax=Sulfurimonas sp. TaxID=2022749 RepID=UPI002620BF05|nr:YcaO-like family protein [Sulfurimonas sp.]MDD2651875.1 YcaO-like family protein [Sulfurimonas sp.]MDD3451808.1 YcaO-like family protein [Sulfurimonas sp.]